MKLAFLSLALLALNVQAAETNLFALVKTIPLPDVRGRIDHFAMDTQGQRLFMAALGNDTVEVIDLMAGRRIHTIGDCSTPQGLAYVPGINRLFIANGGSGTVNMLDGMDFKVLKRLGDLPDADNVRYDAKAGLIYVGDGDGELTVIGATNGEFVAKIPLAGHPESFQLEKNGNRIFVNVPDANQIAVVDRDKRAIITTWPMEKFRSNFPMALDEANHRLFVGCRHPARLVVLDTANGRKISDVEISGDTDDVFYDASLKRIYASCGGGFIDVINQRDPDKYELWNRIPTVSGARTSFFSPEQKEFYLAVRAGLISGNAEIRAYKTR
jgi:DNA-binding beta-propeller fold protein YncE